MSSTNAGSRTYRQVARADSSEELKTRILTAFRQLMLKTWFDDLTLDDVASAAKTTRQTVIRMYGGKIGLLMAALPAINDEINQRRGLKPGSTLEEIAAGIVAETEVLGEMRMSVLALALRNPELKPALNFGRAGNSKILREVLAPWLDPRPTEEAERMFVECLVATDTYTWALLRREYKKTVPETERIITDMLRRILGVPYSPLSGQSER